MKSVLLGFLLLAAGCGAPPADSGSADEQTYSDACTALSARCRHGDDHDCEWQADHCSIGVSRQGLTIARDAEATCSTACCATCTSCVNQPRENSACDWCKNNCGR